MPKTRSGLANQRSPGNYKIFNDSAYGGFEYEGDGREAEDFFQQYSNFDELIREMNYDDIRAFQRWASGEFMNGQQWGDFDNMTSREQEFTRVYDKYLDRSRLDEGVQVVRYGSAELLLGRGKSLASSLSELQAMEGSVIHAKGSMSFGAAKTGLEIGGRKNVEYKLSIPKGTTGAGMWIGDERINGWGSMQREFLTNRDVDYKVGKTTYDSKRDVYVVELRYDGRTKHDYGRRGI